MFLMIMFFICPYVVSDKVLFFFVFCFAWFLKEKYRFEANIFSYSNIVCSLFFYGFLWVPSSDVFNLKTKKGKRDFRRVILSVYLY